LTSNNLWTTFVLTGTPNSKSKNQTICDKLRAARQVQSAFADLSRKNNKIDRASNFSKMEDFDIESEMINLLQTRVAPKISTIRPPNYDGSTCSTYDI